MKISVIIPVFNNLELTKNCVESISKSSFFNKDLEVIIIDDNSDDGTAAYFTQYAQEKNWLIYHRNTSNLKFSQSCNIGAGLAHGEYLIFLNNDTVVTENWDEFLIKTIEKDRNVWMVGAKLLFPNGTLQHAGVYLPELTGKSFGHVYSGFPSYFPPANFEKELQCVTAACIIMRSADFQQVGGFDTAFLNGSEDIELCLKIISQGKKIRYQPKCEIIHFESKSEGRYEHAKQNAELLYHRWKDRMKPDMVEMIDLDFKTTTDNGFLTAIGHYSGVSGLSEIVGKNEDLEFNKRGNIEFMMPANPVSIFIPDYPNRAGNELIIKMGCISSEKTNVTLRYKTRSGYQDDKILKSAQILYKGNNRILFTLKADHFSGLPSLLFEGIESAIEITSFSFFTYNITGKKPLLSALYHAGSDHEQFNKLVQDFKKTGIEAEIELKSSENSLSSFSINAAIASSNADFIIMIGEGVRVNPDFLVHAIEIMELQPKIGFVYSDMNMHKDESVTLIKQDFNPLTVLTKGKTDMAGLFRKKCWESMNGYDESFSCFINYDLFLGIMASGNWKGYKIKYPAFDLVNHNISPTFDYKSERNHIQAKHAKYLLKECGKLISQGQKPGNNGPPEIKLHGATFSARLKRALIKMFSKKT